MSITRTNENVELLRGKISREWEDLPGVGGYSGCKASAADQRDCQKAGSI